MPKKRALRPVTDIPIDEVKHQPQRERICLYHGAKLFRHMKVMGALIDKGVWKAMVRFKKSKPFMTELFFSGTTFYADVSDGENKPIYCYMH